MQMIFENEDQLKKYAAKFAAQCVSPCKIFLKGDLGAGKTTFVRGFLSGLGFDGKVKSPTYTLIEPYEINSISVFHFDLYRLSDVTELEYLGMRDYLEQDAILLVEWPERGMDQYGLPDIVCNIEIIPQGRRLVLEAKTEHGQAMLQSL